MKKLFLLILCCTLLITSCGESRPQSVTYEEDTPQDRINQYIEDLTAEEMAGRRAGTEGEVKASLYLANFFQQAELEQGGELGTYFQTFPIGRYEPKVVKKRLTFQSRGGEGGQAENIIGVVPGKEPGYILISAHYDHLGTIDNHLYPGANDNASGVAAMLELVNQIKGRKPIYSIVFALWSAEEMGLLGSSYFCDHPTVPLKEIKAVINLDSIGNVGNNHKLLGWKAKDNETSQSIVKMLEREGWSIEWEDPDSYNSDQASFKKKDVAGFTLLSPKWLSRNHTIKDEARRVEIDSLADIVLSLKKILLTIGR